MHMTKPHYHIDPYDQSLEATVVALGNHRGKPFVILDQTICYPEGGGQPGDKGTLNTVSIVDTITDDDGQILHLLATKPDLSVGSRVTIAIDWTHRYDYMQQHTAQHLLSGILHSQLHIGTVSVHLGHDDLSIELDADEFSDLDAEAIEDAVNADVRKSVPVTAFEVSQEGATELGLRRQVKVDGVVRIVQIGDSDMIACGGVHVSNTSELRFISFLRTERIRGRVKTYWLAGNRAIAGIRRNRQIVDNAGTLLSLPPNEISEGIAALQSQLVDAKYQTRQLLFRIATLRLSQAVNLAPTLNGFTIMTVDASDWGEQEFKALPETLSDISHTLMCVVREREDGKLAWLLAVKGLTNEAGLFQTIREKALPIIEGKGGGKPPLWQGIGSLGAQKHDFLNQVATLFRGYVDVKAL